MKFGAAVNAVQDYMTAAGENWGCWQYVYMYVILELQWSCIIVSLKLALQ